ncbi:MAG TPA: Hpt domain-containing protein [Rudaea sp.]|nr:Hpt domain-containing protein [Rudaea sp.]
MKLQEDIDFTTLNWVKQELDETLNQARQALEAYVDDPADTSLMRFCATYLHQVQGTLRMVELYGAAMVVDEMEHVAQGLLDGSIKPQDETYSVLMRGIVQLPDYLERLQSGHKDIPIVLLPLLNDLRATRGEKLLTESALFSPDLSAPLPPSAAGAPASLPVIELRAQGARLRTAFQLSLLRWIRDDSAGDQLDRLIDVLDRVRTLCAGEDARRLWWVATGVLESVRSGALEASVAVKLLFGKIDRQIKRLVDGGEAEFAADPPRELTKNLLYYIAHTTATGPRATEIARLYRLDTLLPTEREVEHAKGSISGHNRALLDTVSTAIKDDLLRVKEALDIFLRAQTADPADLAAQGEVLDRVGDTLGMLGLGVPRRVVTEQRQIIGDIANKSRSADETTLLDVAGALLYVEASLDDHIDRLGGEEPQSEDAAVQMELPKAEVRKILDALMKEASVNIAQAKQDIVAFIESPWDHAKVEQIPRLLEEISGALRMLDLTEPATLMTAIVRFVEVELLRHRRVPTVEQMDKLADALASIEYFMEATREQRGGRDQILDVTRSSMESLGYWPIPAEAEGDAAAETSMPPAPTGTTATPAQAEPSREPQPAGEFPASVTTAESTDADADAAHAAATGGDFPQWSEDLSTNLDSGLQFDAAAVPDDGQQLPSIDLPTDASVDDLIASFARSEQAAATATPEAAARAGEYDLTHAVDIAPGINLEDLVVGEAHAHEPVAHDLRGLALSETEPTSPPHAEAVEAAAAPTVRYVEVEEEIEEEVPDTEGAAALPDASFHTSASDEIDAEIREVFVEEVQEEIENLNRQLPQWQADPNDFERLKPIRRSFHTLKGSGRLVGALALGEFSWKVENMLNRVLDRTIGPTTAVQTLTGQAIAALPELLAGLRGEGAPKTDIGAVMAVADRLAVGEDAWVRAGTPRRMKKVRRVVRKLVPVAVEPSQTPEPVVEMPSAVEMPATAESPQAEEASAFSYAAEAPPASGSPLPNIDPVLYEIFTSEVASHLSVIDAFLAESHAAGDALPASEPLLRAVHTLNGAVAMVDVPAITHVLAPLESYIKRLCAGGLAPGPEGLAVLTDVTRVSRAVMSALERGDAHLPESEVLAHRIEVLRDTLPEPQLMHTLFARDEEAAHETAEAPTAPVEAAIEPPAIEPAPTPAEVGQAVPEEAAAVEPAWLAELAGIETVSLSTDELPPIGGDDTVLEDAAATQALDETPPAVEEADLAAMLIEQGGTPLDAPAAATQATASDSTHDADLTATAANQPDAAEPAAARFDDAAFAAELQALDFEQQMPSIELPAVEEPAALEAQAEAAADAPQAERAAEAAPPSPTRRVEPAYAPMLAASMAESLTEAPVLAEDVQPEGKLELAEMDEDLLEIFVQEGADILDHSDSLMAGLRAAPHDRELVGGLQRDLHTLKGGARMAGLAPIGDLSHAMESLLDAISENRRVMDRITVESLERGFDRLHGLVQRVAKRQAIAMPVHAIARFEGLVSGELPVAAPAPEPIAEAPAAETAGVEAAPVPTVNEAAPATAPPRPAPRPLPRFEEEEIQPRAPQEMIRVRSDLLDSLVNYAGEVSIYRSRLEQQISTFRFNLVEFETTVSRLRDQLRKLELETEAQILSRYQREAEATESVFDPLELDRFSQLQQLSRALAESVSDLTSIQGLLDDLTRQSETLLLQQSRVSSDLQEGLMRTRMVPFDSLVPSLRRTLRQAAQELGKRAQLKVEGAQGEMDRNLLERMKAPFEHMMRNALAHGIESPEERLAANKPLDGTVGIQVSREATEVVLRVSDDGRGLDRDAIRRKAIERGILKPDVQLSDRDLYGFILETGFSTAEHVTQLAGRGVGMDVVHNEIKQLGGSLAIDSRHGVGTTFVIRLPFTLAVTQAILVRLGEGTYAVPMSSVQGVVRIARSDLDRRLAEANPSYAYAGEDYLIYELSNLLNVPQSRISDETQLPLLMTRTGDQRAAVRVDAVIGSREIVVKSVGPQISSVPGIFGATIMGDGSVVMILDLAPLVRRHAALRERVEGGEVAAPAPVMPEPAPAAAARRQPLIMVVDDSITMRKVTTRVLERNEMDVVTAKDGLDAVEKLQEKVPDVVLLDVEMPRMDGYELATYMKNDARLKYVPIIMITSRTGEKHRQRALEIGVERYLGKPYQEADLLRNLQETLRLSRA